MTIEKKNIGAYGKTTVYSISEEGREIARYKTLEEAALVLRYMSGANMTETDMEAARAILREQ